jgi:hypothetical protein
MVDSAQFQGAICWDDAAIGTGVVDSPGAVGGSSQAGSLFCRSFICKGTPEGTPPCSHPLPQAMRDFRAVGLPRLSRERSVASMLIAVPFVHESFRFSMSFGGSLYDVAFRMDVNW